MVALKKRYLILIFLISLFSQTSFPKNNSESLAPAFIETTPVRLFHYERLYRIK
jgi:hypothetical protein